MVKSEILSTVKSSLRQNWQQFTLLAGINAFAGGIEQLPSAGRVLLQDLWPLNEEKWQNRMQNERTNQRWRL